MSITNRKNFAQEKGLPSAPPPPGPAEKKAPGVNGVRVPGTLVTLKVWRVAPKNQTLLIAYEPQHDPENPMLLCNVRVGTNRNFLPGMLLQAAYVNHNSFNLVGPCPRYRGRW